MNIRISNNSLDKDDLYSEMLADTDYEVLSTYHNTLQATPYSLIFVWAMIINTPFIADWEAIRLCNEKRRNKNNQLENKNRKPHRTRIQEKVSVRNKK